MLNRIRMVLIAVVGFCWPQFAIAHPGHGTTQSGPAHYVLEPVHGMPIAAVLAIAIAIAGVLVVMKTHRKTQNS